MVWYTFKKTVHKVSKKSAGITIPSYFLQQYFVKTGGEYTFAIKIDNAPKTPPELDNAPTPQPQTTTQIIPPKTNNDDSETVEADYQEEDSDEY